MGFLKIRKPKAIFFDMCATMTKSHFMDQVLFHYFREAAKPFLETHWSNDIVQGDIKRLREQSKSDGGPKIVADSEGPEAIRASVIKYIESCLAQVPKRESDALAVFRFHVIFDGYARDRIKTPVYSDVAFQIRHWSVDLKIKLFIFSNCWIEATKRFLMHTNHGNMNLLIEEHFDNTIGSLEKSETYSTVVKKVNITSDDVLFLTHNPKEAIAAKKAGLSVLLVVTHRRDIAVLPEEEKALSYIRSFNELAFSTEAPTAAALPPGSCAGEENSSSSLKRGDNDSKTQTSKPKSNIVLSKTSIASSSGSKTRENSKSKCGKSKKSSKK